MPLSLQALLESTEYPPEPLATMTHRTTKVVMVVETVSPTPFALLRRARNFEYKAEDRDLQEFSLYEDPVHVLTDECRRVLRSISSSNESDVSKASDSTGLNDTSWSRFEDIGFSGSYDESEADGENDFSSMPNRNRHAGMRRGPHSKTTDLGRPTTPSWADFLSSGFVEDGHRAPAPLLLPPDKILPPINTSQRGHSSQSHRRNLDNESDLEPGELANINKFDMDDAFWWVWISSLAGEEPTLRKAVFGRCALLETVMTEGRWLVLEEQVKGAAVQPAPGAYVAEKKGFFSFASRKNKMNRRKSGIRKSPLGQDPYQKSATAPSSKVTIGPDQHARIQAAAAALQQKNMEKEIPSPEPARRGRFDDTASTKTASVFTLQPVIMSEASPAMKWASQYDKAAIRAKYLGDNLAGKGGSTEMLTLPPNGVSPSGTTAPAAPAKAPQPPIEEQSEAAQLQRPVADQEPQAPPPPPPAATVAEMQPINEEAEEAAEVPLPAPTPARVPQPQESAPAPPPGLPAAQEVPLPETPVKEVPATAAAPVAPVEQPTLKSPKKSPEQKKLKKRNQPGFKGIFGKKDKAGPPQEVHTAPSAENTAAVAAARAALGNKQSPPPQQAANPPAPEPASKSSRFAGLRNRPAHRAAQLAPPARKPVPDQQDELEPPAAIADQSTPTSDKFKGDRPRTQRDDEYDQLSRVDTDEREDADREFSQFDQGPMNDHHGHGHGHAHHAYAPEPSTEPPAYESHEARQEPQQSMPSHYAAATADEGLPEEDEYDRIDEEDEEDEADYERPSAAGFAPAPAPSPPVQQDDMSAVQVQDRWAQIRKNAAERAARQSDDQGRLSTTDKTDDGETSGEESKHNLCVTSRGI